MHFAKATDACEKVRDLGLKGCGKGDPKHKSAFIKKTYGVCIETVTHDLEACALTGILAPHDFVDEYAQPVLDSLDAKGITKQMNTADSARSSAQLAMLTEQNLDYTAIYEDYVATFENHYDIVWNQQHLHDADEFITNVKKTIKKLKKDKADKKERKDEIDVGFGKKDKEIDEIEDEIKEKEKDIIKKDLLIKNKHLEKEEMIEKRDSIETDLDVIKNELPDLLKQLEKLKADKLKYEKLRDTYHHNYKGSLTNPEDTEEPTLMQLQNDLKEKLGYDIFDF